MFKTSQAQHKRNAIVNIGTTQTTTSVQSQAQARQNEITTNKWGVNYEAGVN